MSSNQKHIEVIEQMLAISQKYEGDRPGTTSAALIAAKEALEREGEMEADRDFWLNLAKSFAEQIGEIQRSMLMTVAQRAVELKKMEASDG